MITKNSLVLLIATFFYFSVLSISSLAIDEDDQYINKNIIKIEPKEQE